MELNDVASITGKMNDPGPSPETEIDNPYRYILATEEPIFYRFLKLPREIRDMIWDHAVDRCLFLAYLFQRPSPLSSMPRIKAACLRRYSTFRDPERSEWSKTTLRLLKIDYEAWIDYERDVLQLSYMSCHWAMNGKYMCNLPCVNQACKDLVLPVKILGIEELTLWELMDDFIDIWNRFAEICPQVTHLKIIERGEKSTEQEIPHKRCLQRMTMNDLCPGSSMNRLAKEMDEFIANHGPLSYEVEFAKFAPNPELEKKIVKRKKQGEEEAFNEATHGPLNQF
ncbi:uncharacterized protein EAF02_010245 [Botrytis sinoallii]|uniref:uncharacterized protein n=1 Tax=Botrytis sinoallii TaxID=1463999 RepID=UPI0018FF4284|nr:uncharacterized protein EAF02_010245 [Botrytis sinoallii]KAF7864277.1 hypothetical protein EAF02_010245 [Botrytis sinoallii]